MDTRKWVLLIINLIGGIAVLGSYAQGILTHPGAGDILWGEVPKGIRPIYTMGMFLAAEGYFAFTCFVFLYLNPDTTQVFGRYGFGLFNILYIAILLPSALWMPLTFMAVEQSSQALLWLVRLVLWAVAAASLILLFALLNVQPHQPEWAHRLAIIGSILFCLQTVILDGLVWIAFFKI